jgi:hypothetical protein
VLSASTKFISSPGGSRTVGIARSLEAMAYRQRQYVKDLGTLPGGYLTLAFRKLI